MKNREIHAMLDQLEQECNGAAAVPTTIDMDDLLLILQTVLESMTTLDPGQIAEVLDRLCQTLEGGDPCGEARSDDQGEQ